MKLTPQTKDIGTRIDVWLKSRLPGLSRTRIQSLIRSGHITVNQKTAKSHHCVGAGNIIEVQVPPPKPAKLAAEDIPLDVLYEDQTIIVVNKAPGMVVHPAPGHKSGTLVHALLAHCQDLAGIGGEMRPGIVHRLDRDTSGVIVAAKTEAAMAELVRQFKYGEVHKDYLAIVWGIPDPPRGRIETLIGRSTSDRKKMSATPTSGRRAVTNYMVEKTFADLALVRVNPETGRTHQIRVHMKFIGHPIVGDTQYQIRNRKATLQAPIRRQMLHAERLSIMHPATGRQMTFVAPIPPDMGALLDVLRPRREDK